MSRICKINASKYAVNISKYATNASKIRGKDLTDDEKRQIYRSAFKETRKKLMTVFTKDQVDKITEFEKMSFKK